MDILIDVGGTKTRVAVGRGKSFSDLFVFATKKEFADELVVFKEWLEGVKDKKEPLRFIIGLPGTLSLEKTELDRAPNLLLWENIPIKKIIEETFNASAYLENDTALVGLGEAHFGAGRGFGIVAYISVSTGVGGARIVDGKIDQSSFGFEPGHQIIEGKDLELQIGGAALKHHFAKDPKEITDPAIWAEITRVLAVGLYNVALLWSPEVIILGGSMVRGTPGVSITKTEKATKELLKIFPHPPAIIPSTLEDLGGLWGGVAYSEIFS